jgi:bifunctional non-homologous end joining protein LigD
VLPAGRTAFNLIQNASDTVQGSLVFFLFDVLLLDDESLMVLPLIDRKARLAKLLSGAPSSLQYNDHQIGRGPGFQSLACERGLEGHRLQTHQWFDMSPIAALAQGQVP